MTTAKMEAKMGCIVNTRQCHRPTIKRLRRQSNKNILSRNRTKQQERLDVIWLTSADLICFAFGERIVLLALSVPERVGPPSAWRKQAVASRCGEHVSGQARPARLPAKKEEPFRATVARNKKRGCASTWCQHTELCLRESYRPADRQT